MSLSVDPQMHSRLVGAWARYLLRNHPRVEIQVAPYLPGGFRHFAVRYVEVLAIVPWGRPDPRGPLNETRRRRWDGKHWVVSDEREPMHLSTIVHLGDVVRPLILDKHAMIAAARVQRELDRGYAIVQDGPAPADFVGLDRPALPRRAGGETIRHGEWAVVLDEEGRWWHFLTPERAFSVVQHFLPEGAFSVVQPLLERWQA